MLDVHPPPPPPHTWRDFLLHIATIVIGLLIAIGLEQTVEAIHHRRVLAETRQDLQGERELDRGLYERYVQYFHWETAELENNMLVLTYLQQHPGTPQEKLPGVLNWRWAGPDFSHAVWDTAQQSTVTGLMPRDEVIRYARFYENLQMATASSDKTWVAVTDARKYSFRDSDPSHLTPSQLNDEIELLKTARMNLYVLGINLDHFPGLFPDFHVQIAAADMDHLEHYPDPQTWKTLEPARLLTDKRLTAAGYRPRKMTPDGWADVSSTPERKLP
jgi:hypothetical protein